MDIVVNEALLMKYNGLLHQGHLDQTYTCLYSFWSIFHFSCWFHMSALLNKFENVRQIKMKVPTELYSHVERVEGVWPEVESWWFLITTPPKVLVGDSYDNLLLLTDMSLFLSCYTGWHEDGSSLVILLPHCLLQAVVPV